MVAAALVASIPANAIVIRDDVGNAGAVAFGKSFTGVVSWFNGPSDQVYCSGSLVGEHKKTILTARHCLQNGEQPSYVHFHGATTDLFQAIPVARWELLDTPATNTDWFLDGYDLALLYLRDTAPAWAEPLDFLWSDSSALRGKPFTMVGFGSWGVGSTGAVNAPDDIRRAATNVVDFYGPDVDDDEVNGNCEKAKNTDNLLAADFDNPPGTANRLVDCGSQPEPSNNEGITGPADSGGPLLVWDSKWLIAGVLAGGVSPSRYGGTSAWTGTNIHKGWITTRVGEPASLALLALGLAGLGLSRRRKAD